MRIISEEEFSIRIQEVLQDPIFNSVGWVTGPGRSGAIAAVYASHILHIPFVPFGSEAKHLERPLIIDTARQSGATLKKAIRKYQHLNPISCVLYEEPPRVAFWYEGSKPQHYKHEPKLRLH